MKRFNWIVLLSFALLFIFPSVQAFANEKVYHIPLENQVEKGLYAFLDRAFDEATENGAEAIILEIHTPGGYVDAAYDIAKLMDETDPDIIAFINSHALSAGAYLALHADRIYMVPNGTIGAAQIIDGEGNAAEAKADSAWKAQMQTAAESSNRNPEIALAMADPSQNFPEYRAPEGSLLTLSAEEAIKVKYSEGTVQNLDEILAIEGLINSEIVEVKPTIAEEVARFITNPVVVTLLLTIASVGLAIELFSPGFGLPGTVGITSLALFFFGHTVAGFAGYESIILFIIGFALLLAEFFVPGGIVGLIGGALVIISLLFAGESVVHMAYSILVAIIIAVIGMVVMMKFLGKRLHFFNKLVLRDATTTEEGYVSNENRLDLIGKMGETLTPLRPAGTILVDNERIDAVSEGSYINLNKKVEIIKVEGSRIVVREIKEEMK